MDPCCPDYGVFSQQVEHIKCHPKPKPTLQIFYNTWSLTENGVHNLISLIFLFTSIHYTL